MTSPIEASNRPLAHSVDDFDGVGTPDVRLDRAQRLSLRSLENWQKEAVVSDFPSGTSWRLASDEGPYAKGADDAAPSPLCYFTAGMVSMFADEFLAAADRRDVPVEDLTMVLDNYYTRSGSVVRGTRTAGALPPELALEVDSAASDETVADLLDAATETAPVNGLLTDSHETAYRLFCNGDEISTGEVASLAGNPLPDPGELFEDISPAAPNPDESPVQHLHRPTEQLPDDEQKFPGYDPSANLEALGSPDESDVPELIIHMRGTCRIRDDGLREVQIEVFHPPGSMFRFLSDPDGPREAAPAPDATTYLASGLAFCFTTHIQSYAQPLGKEISDLRMIQDSHFSAGGASSGSEGQGEALPLEGHVYLEIPDGEEFAREAFRIADESCFLQALCRTPELEPIVRSISTGA